MDQRLNVIFSGDGTSLSKTISELERQLKAFEAGLKTTSGVDSFNRLNRAIDATKSRLDTLKSASNGFNSATGNIAKSFNTISSSAGQADFALLNFGRILQDAPFGLIGFANNINPAVEAMTRLSASAKETGTSVGSLLLKSLTGTGGLLFGVSLITSALQFAAIGLSAFTRGFGGAKTEIDAATISLGQFNEKLASTQSSFDNFKIGTNFRTDLKKITAEAGGAEGAKLDIFGLKESIKANEFLIKKVDEQADQIARPLARINAGIEKLRGEQIGRELDPGLKLKGLSEAEIKKKFGDPILNVIDQFKDITLIPESALDGLEKKDREIVEELIKLNKDLDGISKVRQELVNQNELSLLKIRVAANKEQERLDDLILKRARQFTKEFGDAFVVPDLEETFFKGKKQLLPLAQKLLSDVAKGKLKIKLPVETEIEFETGARLEKQFEDFQDSLRQRMLADVGNELKIPITVIPDLSLSKDSLKQIDEKVKLFGEFKKLGKIGKDAFFDIDFTNINKGLLEGTKLLQGMVEVASTFNQAIGQGLTSAFDAAFDAALEGKDVFKALGEGLKQLVIGTIKAIAQMLILKAITNLIFPGAGGFVPGIRLGGAGQVAAPSFSGGIGGRAAPSLVATVRGADLAFVLTQGGNQIGRVG